MTLPTEDIEEPKLDVVEDNHTQDEQKPEDDKEKNWKAFLEKRKEDQRALEAERKRNQELQAERDRRTKELEEMKLAFQAVVDKKEPEYSYDQDVDQNKLIEEKVNQIISKREQERSAREEEQRRAREIQEIKEKMPDIEQVLSPDNLAYLEFYHPKMARLIAKMPEGLDKIKETYEAVKEFVKMPTKEKEKIDKNLGKPKSVHSSVSNESQKEESSGVLSDKRRMETWQKMQRLISGEDEE